MEYGMTARETFFCLLANKGIVYAIWHFRPIKRVCGQWFIMLPHWYNGHFSMKSINRMK
jgi:hypothetical protein